MSLLHGDGLHDMIITGENDSIDGHGDVWWKYRCIYVIKRGNITMTQAGNKSYTKRQSTVVGWVLLWSFDDCLMDVNVFV
ncbi:hypothetical protein A4A49_25767 [Nicotiana attenuata]|uniref:Uncharacterized protein n=1 Tax=Nicotiana attenuata TaxID=49451 RepID=A0A1J6KC17_NICAT|nr:hypothetical protein A4A49_25767 [Nicotiana attenuata]